MFIVSKASYLRRVENIPAEVHMSLICLPVISVQVLFQFDCTEEEGHRKVAVRTVAAAPVLFVN